MEYSTFVAYSPDWEQLWTKNIFQIARLSGQFDTHVAGWDLLCNQADIWIWKQYFF